MGGASLKSKLCGFHAKPLWPLYYKDFLILLYTIKGFITF